jgi:hypothetical protein
MKEEGGSVSSAAYSSDTTSPSPTTWGMCLHGLRRTVGWSRRMRQQKTANVRSGAALRGMSMASPQWRRLSLEISTEEKISYTRLQVLRVLTI